jgi:hypothetical protein
MARGRRWEAIMKRMMVVLLGCLVMLVGWAAPAQAGRAVVEYPTITAIAFTWTPADAGGTCHNTTVGTLSAPITATTRVTARWTLTAISPSGDVWPYQMWIGSPAVGSSSVGPWTIGACSSDGARYVSVRIELFKGTRVSRTAMPYTAKTVTFAAGYVCTW